MLFGQSAYVCCSVTLHISVVLSECLSVLLLSNCLLFVQSITVEPLVNPTGVTNV